MNYQILTVVTGISGLFSLMALCVYLYFQLSISRAERSVKEIVEGEGVFKPEQVLEILKSFSDDNSRLEALKVITHHDGEKARNILSKVKANVDIERLMSIDSANYRKISKRTALVFSGVSVIGLLYAIVANPISPVITKPASRQCNYENLLTVSNDPIPVYVPGESRSHICPEPNGWSIDFSNENNGTALAFTFQKSLDVRDCNQLEITGVSTNPIHFIVEYKAKLDNGNPVIMAQSPRKFFRGGLSPQSVKVPLSYDGTVNEIVINFVRIGEKSKFTIESLRLLP